MNFWRCHIKNSTYFLTAKIRILTEIVKERVYMPLFLSLSCVCMSVCLCVCVCVCVYECVWVYGTVEDVPKQDFVSWRDKQLLRWGRCFKVRTRDNNFSDLNRIAIPCLHMSSPAVSFSYVGSSNQCKLFRNGMYCVENACGNKPLINQTERTSLIFFSEEVCKES